MKKISLLLAFMLTMCSFAACGDKDDNDDEEKLSSVSDNEKDKDDDDNDEKKLSSNPDKDKDDDDEKSGEFERGTVEGNVYTNEFCGLTFETPDDWTIYSDEQIKETMGVGLEAGGSSLDADKLVESAVCDFAAVNQGIGESIAFTFENASKFPENYTMDQYISAFKLSTKAAMPNADIDWHMDGEKAELCGIEFDTFGSDVKIEEYGLDITQEYCLAEVNGYMLSIAYTSGYTSKSMNDYTDCFKD